MSADAATQEATPTATRARLTVRAAPPEHFPWIMERTGCGLTQGTRAIEAVDSTGRIVGMVAYDNWTPNSVQAHMAVEYAAVWRSLKGPAFSYPFEECGRSVLLGVITADNERSAELARSFGFTEAHRIRDGWAAGVDLIVFEMRRNECRHITQTGANNHG